MEMSYVVPPTSTTLVVFFVEMSFVVPLTSNPLVISLVEMSSMVPFASAPSIISHVEMSYVVFYNMFGYLYNYWHYKWFHFAMLTNGRSIQVQT